MGKLKVLCVLGHGGLGGIERHVQSLVRCLRAEDVEAAVCVLMEGGEVSRMLAQGGVEVHVLGARNGHEPSLLLRFCKLIMRVKPDVVHFHELHLLPAQAMRLFPRIPLVYSEHCSIADAPHLRAVRMLWAAAGDRIDRILPVSRYTGEMMTRYLGVSPGRMRTVYNGLDVAALRARGGLGRNALKSAAGNERIVGGIGRLAAQKDWGSFLEAARYLTCMRNDVRFAVVGDGPLRGQLKRQATRLGLEDRVSWLGFRDDAFDLLREFNVFLFTSLHEELPTTLLEVFAAKVPVAGFIPRGGTSEVLQLCNEPPGVFIPQRSPRALAGAVDALLETPARAEAMIEEGFEVLLRHFDMRKIARQVALIYRSLNHR